MGSMAEALGPLLDTPPVDVTAMTSGKIRDVIDNWVSLKAVVKAGIVEPLNLTQNLQCHIVQFVLSGTHAGDIKITFVIRIFVLTEFVLMRFHRIFTYCIH